MEWKNISSMEYGKIFFHSIPYHALSTAHAWRLVFIFCIKRGFFLSLWAFKPTSSNLLLTVLLCTTNPYAAKPDENFLHDLLLSLRHIFTIFRSNLGVVLHFLRHFRALFASKSSLFLSFFFIRPTVLVEMFSVFAILTIFKALRFNNIFTCPFSRRLKSLALPIFNHHRHSEQNKKG